MSKFKAAGQTGSSVYAGGNTHEVSSIASSRSARLLRLRQVLDLFPVSRSSWYAGIASGIYPQPVKLSARSVAWPEEAIHALIAQKSANAQSVFVM